MHKKAVWDVSAMPFRRWTVSAMGRFGDRTFRRWDVLAMGRWRWDVLAMGHFGDRAFSLEYSA